MHSLFDFVQQPDPRKCGVQMLYDRLGAALELFLERPAPSQRSTDGGAELRLAGPLQDLALSAQLSRSRPSPVQAG